MSKRSQDPLGLRNEATAVRAVLFAVAAIALGTASAAAQESIRPRLSFGAFGTLGVAYSTEDQADFWSDLSRSEGPGYTRTVDPAMDSRLAGQVTVDVGPKLSSIVQLMVEQNTDRSFVPNIEWASLRYLLSPGLSVRAGRFVWPVFLFSESRKVTYSNRWIRPPGELYGFAPVHSWDGADISYRTHLGEWTAVFGGAVGGQEYESGAGGKAEGKWLRNVNVKAERGGLVVRGLYGEGTLHSESANFFFDRFRQFGAEGDAIADRYDLSDSRLQVLTAGAEYDARTWFLIAEAGWQDTDSYVGEKLGGYVSGGYHIGRVTPYATYAAVELLSESSHPGVSLVDLPAEQAQIAAELNDALNMRLSSSARQRTLTVGGRFDLRPGIAFNAEVDFINVLGNSTGTFINVQPDFRPGGSARLLSIATSFVL